jgi:putative transposase
LSYKKLMIIDAHVITINSYNCFMPQYRRSFIPGGTFFFTVVTYHRLPILVSEPARDNLHRAWTDVKWRFLFTAETVCLLSDPLHSALQPGQAWVSAAGERLAMARFHRYMKLGYYDKEWGGVDPVISPTACGE